MPPVEFRIVDEAPTEAIEALYRMAGWWKDRAGEREAIPAMIRGSLVFAIAVHSGQIVGMGRAISDGVSDAWIQDVVVRPEHRGMGIGTGLLRLLVQACRERGLQWIGLVAERGSRPFYERIGFKALEGEPMVLESEDTD